ncbi:MAG: cysteine desulfurase family protein [Alphaproteobacteria bacterium]
MSLKFPIYLDNQASTPLDPRVLEAMTPHLSENFGNPHSEHHFGWQGMAAIDVAREKVAGLIGAKPKEILFCSGATEANNLAIKGIAETFRGKKNKIITLKTEHKCVIESALYVSGQGTEVVFLDVGSDGMIDMAALEAAMDDNTALVSVMAVNNEIGVIQPMKAIGALCRAKGVLFHSDGAQGFGKIPLDVEAMNIDLMSVTAHKAYGPIGAGALYVREKVKRLLTPQMSGGGQEAGIRSGTLSPALCVGLGKVAEIAADEMEGEALRMKAMFDGFLGTLKRGSNRVKVNGPMADRWFGNLNVSFPGVKGELLIAALKKISVSSGSACLATETGPSYVLMALGLSDEELDASLRIGFGRFTTSPEAEFAANYLLETLEKVGNS